MEVYIYTIPSMCSDTYTYVHYTKSNAQMMQWRACDMYSMYGGGHDLYSNVCASDDCSGGTKLSEKRSW